MPEKPAYEKMKRKIAHLEETIADLNQKMKKLQQREQLLNIMAEKSFAGAYVSQDGSFKFGSWNTFSFAGYTIKDLLGVKSDSLIHPEDRNFVKTSARAMLRGERTAPYEFRIVTRGGQIRWVVETVTPILYEGKPAILGNSMDITERNLAEDARRESERRLADIIEFLPDAAVVINCAGEAIAWNRAMEKMTGVSAKDMLGKGNYEYSLPFYGDRRPVIVDFVLKPDEALEKQSSGFDRQKNELVVETWVPGINAYVWGKSSPLYDNNGHIVGAIAVLRDITARKLAEDALRESERRLADIIEFLPDATLVVNCSGEVIAWNRAIEKMTGVNAKDIVGKGNYEYSLPFYGERRPVIIDLVLKPDETVEKTYLTFDREKQELVVETWAPCINAFVWCKSSPLYNNKGDIVGAIEVIRDITERKLAEDALRESERRLADIIEFLPDATLVVNCSGEVIAWNRAIEKMTGVSAKDMVGKGDYEYALPFYGERRPLIIDLVLEPDESVEKTYSIFDRQKNELVVETWAPGMNAFVWGKSSPLYDNKGNIVGAIEVIRDITERKLAEDALRESERRLADIIEFLPDAAVVVNCAGEVIAWNRAIEKMTGVSAKDMVGKGDYEYALPFYEERRPIIIDLVLKPDEAVEKTYSAFDRQTHELVAEKWAPGINAFVWCKSSPLYDNKGHIVGAIEVLRDITERKMAEESLIKRERE
ncbi:MAG: PAS domain S-box protein, partial [Syntrophales bacterium]|nr:PAS domain S-box protein [Syntrophales bacterium]